MASTVSVGSTPVAVFTPQQYATTATLTNAGTSPLYLGQSGVTAATGFPLAPGQSVNQAFTVPIYAVSGVDVIGSPTDTLSAPASATDTALTVASGGASFTNGMTVSIIDGNNTELVTVGAGSTATSVVVSALAFAHASGVTFGQFASSTRAAACRCTRRGRDRMAITVGQVTLTGSSQDLVAVPPGPCTLLVSNTGGATVYVGPGTVTAANGFAIPDGAPPVAVPGFLGSRGTQVNVIGTAADTVCWMLSTPG